MQSSLINTNSQITDIPLRAEFPYRFDIDTEACQMVDYLHKNGYAVVKSVANEDQIKLAKDHFWDWATKFSPDLKRENSDTWINKNWVSDPKNGICSFINHSEFAWMTRLLPKVKKSFASIWQTDDLIVSFDAGNAFRPWKRNPDWKTVGGWWHVDQNANNKQHKEGMVCVQGLVSYYDANEESGGLCLIPKSHLNFNEICSRAPAAKLGIDFVQINVEEQPCLQGMTGSLICAKAGDLILWDSRTVHCNTPTIVNQEVDECETIKYNEIIRLVSYVCMVPYSHASRKVIENRKEGFIVKAPSSHWPTKKVRVEINCDEQPFEIDKISKEMLHLVGYREKENTCGIY